MLVQAGIVPEFILFFDCPEDEMERRVLGRNQVVTLIVVDKSSTNSVKYVGCMLCTLSLFSANIFDVLVG